MIRLLVRCVAIALVASASLAPGLHASIDRGFDPGANGNVYAAVVQPDGKILLGGSFTTLQPNGIGAPVARHRLARLNADGSLDPTFNPDLDGDVVTLALQPDGGILAGGKFTQAASSIGGTMSGRSGLVRLTSGGTVDASFNPNPTGGSKATPRVGAIAVQADGKILIGGAFTALQPGATGTSFSRLRLARLNANGTVDQSFATQANNLVFSLALQRDGRVLVGGAFTTLQPSGASAPLAATRLARLNSDGSLDTSFSPSANNRVLALALEADGRILAGGDFITVRGTGDESDIFRSFVARFNADGTLDGEFNPRASASVAAIAVQHDGMILLGGSFISLHSVNTGVDSYNAYLVRLNRGGEVDASFRPTPNAQVAAIALQSDGRIVVGGYFSRVRPVGSTNGIIRHRVARFQPSGTLDATFATAEDAIISMVAAESDGSQLVVGTFNNLAGLTRANLARVLPDGTIDPAFHPDVVGSVSAVAVQSDGKILIGGYFSEVNGTERRNLARLNRDGSLDSAYDPSPSDQVNTIVIESDGQALIGGNFATFNLDDGQNDDDDADGLTNDDTARRYFARLTASGTLTSLDLGLDSSVQTIALQSDGKILLGGNFTYVGGKARTAIARLDSDGTVDPNFQPNPNGAVIAIAVQSDGKIVFSGNFSNLQLDDGENDDDDSDGFTTDDADRSYLARLNADGTLDRDFKPTPNSTVNALLVRSDGKLLIGGSFTSLQDGAVARGYLARLNVDGSVDTTFTVQANDIVARLSGPANGVVIVSGRFNSVYDAAGDSLAAESHIARLQTAGAIDHAWNLRAASGLGQQVAALGLQSNGGIVVGGTFSELAGSTNTNLARLNPSGFPDTTFAAKADGPVNAVFVQPRAAVETPSNILAWLDTNGHFRSAFDRRKTSGLSGRISAVLAPQNGAIVIGGAFPAIDGSSGRNLARILADGSLDTAFNPAPDADVFALVRQSDGRILVGGAFTTIAGVSRGHLARLNADGSLDTTFNPPALNGNVTALVVQSDGSVVVGGTFTSVEVDDGENDDDDIDGVTNDDTGRNYICRFDSTGKLDTTYNPNANGTVVAMVLESDGRLTIGGNFTSLQPNKATTATARSYLARLNTDGTVNDAFNPGLDSSVTLLVRQPDGKLLFSGVFGVLQFDDGENDDDDYDGTTTDDADRPFLARLNADDTFDRSFNPRPNAAINTMFVQTDGRIVVAGGFTTFQPNSGDFVIRNSIARLNSDGTVDTTFNPNASGIVYAAAPGDGGSIVVGGSFTELQPKAPLYVGGGFTKVGGLALPGFARLNTDGNPDGAFVPQPNGAVLALAGDLAGNVYVGGDFTQIAGAARTYFASLDSDGNLAGSPNPTLNGSVTALAVQIDGGILLGGNFTQVNGVSASRLARLQTNGARDASFTATLDSAPSAIVALADGSILVGGGFTAVNGVSRANLARLLSNGTLDTTFAPTLDGPVRSIAAAANGELLIGGDFTKVNGSARVGLVRLSAGGALSAAPATVPNAGVRAIAIVPDGSALVGGSFTTIDGAPAFLLSRITTTSAATQQFGVRSDRRSVVWNLSGPAPGFSAVQFSYSTDGNLWNYLGIGTRSQSSAGTSWMWAGTTELPANTNYSIRVRALQAITQGGSGGVVESAWQFYNTDPAGVGYPPLAALFAVVTDSGSVALGLPGGSGGFAGVAAPSSDSMLADDANPDASGSLTAFGTLAYVDAGESVTTSFVINGASPRRILLRAVGPGLAGLSIDDHVPQPILRLYSNAGHPLAAQSGLADAAAVRTAENALAGLLAPVTESDAALIVELAPGGYTLTVGDATGAAGFVLADIHDTSGAVPAFTAYSAKPPGGEASLLTTDFAVRGAQTRTILLRALGGSAEATPVIAVKTVSGASVASSSNLTSSLARSLGTDRINAQRVAAVLAGIRTAGTATDAPQTALLVDVPPGDYSVTVTTPDGAAGVQRLEIFEVAKDLPIAAGVSRPGF